MALRRRRRAGGLGGANSRLGNTVAVRGDRGTRATRHRPPSSQEMVHEMPEQALKREVVSLRECDLFCRLSFFAGDMDFFASPATINMPVRNSPVTPPATISGALGAAAILEATTRPIVPARAAWAPINCGSRRTPKSNSIPIATLCPSHSQAHQLLAA